MLELEEAQGLSADQVKELQQEIRKMAKMKEGEVRERGRMREGEKCVSVGTILQWNKQ